MDAKDWFMRGWKLDKEVDRLMAARDAVKAKVMSVTASLGGVVVDCTKDPHKNDRLVEYEDALDRHIDEYVDITREIEAVIHQIPDERYRTLLIDRYMLFKPWKQIAVDEGYCKRHIKRLHGEALKAAEEYIQEGGANG